MSFTYKGLTGKLERYTVTVEEVEKGLQQMLQQNPRITDITDRPTAQGDEVVLDYAGFCDGEQFAGGTAQDQTLVLGSGMFIPGFEEQLVGKMPGQEVLVKVTFPQVYHSDKLAGKEAEFRCKLKAIREKKPYELDDTFAKEVGQCDTLEQMRQRLQQSMQSYADERSEMDLQDSLLRQAADSLELPVSDQMLEAELAVQLQNLQAQLAQQGLTLEMYCNFTNTTEEALKQELKPQAEFAIHSRAAIDKIVELEGLTADPEDVEKALAVICRHNRITMEDLKEQYDDQLDAAVKSSVLTGKVMRLIRDTAIITD